MMDPAPASARATWAALDLTGAPADGPVAFRDDLSPAGVLDACRHGLFPFPAETDEQRFMHEITFEAETAAGRIPVFDGEAGANPYAVAWWSPDPRPVILVKGARVQRSLRQQLRNKVDWTTTLDACFDHVLQLCRAGREPRWLTDELAATLSLLNGAGHAHSVEVWEGDTLVGGTFGVRVGGVFSADSQFYLRSGAAKAAVADLVRRFAECGGVAVDVQHSGHHAALLGARPLPREEYLKLLRVHSADSRPLPAEPAPARRLAD